MLFWGGGAIMSLIPSFFLKTAAVICLAAPAFAESVTTVASAPIEVDVRDGDCRMLSPEAVCYSPRWGGVTNAGAYVVLEKIENFGGENPRTTTLLTAAADAESAYSLSVGEGDARYVRLVHRVYSSGGVEIGEPLVRDVVFGYNAAAGTGILADSRTNSLQLAVKSRGTPGLTYSTAWASDSAAVTISAIRLAGRDGAETGTNSVFSAAADAEGTTALPILDVGWWKLRCNVTDGSGASLLEYLTDQFRMPGGTVLVVE